MAGVLLHEWLSVVRRARLGRTVKAVALMLSTYANVDGTRVYPGIARLAVECELSTKAVKGALAALRAYGLIEVVRSAHKAGEHNEYRLIFADDLIEHLDVPSPSRHAASISAVAESIRGKHVPQGTPVPAAFEACGDLRGTAGDAGDDAEAAPAGNDRDADPAPAGNGEGSLRGTPIPPTYQGPRQETTNHETTADVRTDVTAPRARCPTHPWMDDGSRDDGRPVCTLCRVAARETRPTLTLIEGGAA